MQQIRLNTHDAIIEAAFAVFAENPGASLSDVAERAGVGRATLHRHFNGRSDLMNALAKKANEELEEAIANGTASAASHTEGLRLALEAMVPLANRQWFLSFQAEQFEGEMAEVDAAGKAELEAAIRQAQKEGSFRAEVPISWLVQAYENLLFAAWTMVKDGEATPKQATDLAWQTLTEGNGAKQP